MILPAFFRRLLPAVLRVMMFGALALAAAVAAEEPKRSYNIPGGEAAVSLRQFSETSGKEVLFAAETVRGVRMPTSKKSPNF